MSTPLIPRKILFGNPDKTQVLLSPDGRHISYLAPLDGVLNVWVAPAEDPANARPVTHDRGRGIRFHAWAHTNDHVLFIQDQGGDENWRIYSACLSTGQILDLTPYPGVSAQIQAISPRHPQEVLVGLNDRLPQYHDLYRIELATGQRTLVQQNEAFTGFVCDEDYNVRLGIRMTPDGGAEVLQPPDAAVPFPSTPEGWRPFLSIPFEDQLTTYPLFIDRSGRTLYLADSRGRDTAGLFAVDLQTGAQSLLAEDRRADLGDLLVHPREKTVQAASFNYERPHWQVLDPQIAPDLDYLATVCPGDLYVPSRTLDDRSWIVAYVVDNGPQRFYRYDRPARQAHFLFTDRQALEGYALSSMRPVVIPTRDGLEMVCYYVLPVESSDPPAAPLPMVLMPHGGPWGRDTWGYDPFVQWMANRGYAVLEVNFRASTGFGKQFTNAGNRQWGARMHDDLIDAVNWAVEQKIADPHQVAIFGASYGGYSVLAGLTFTPEVFACGVDLVGPANLVTLLQTVPEYWKPQLEMFVTRIGDFRTAEGRQFLTSRSPLTYAGRICRPLLIGQGANDPRVKRAESEQVVQACQQKGIPVTYLLYPDEGHGFARPENWMSFNAVAEAFLAQVLGGRYEPVGDSFHNSSMSAIVGAEGVPGLKEALEAHLPEALDGLLAESFPSGEPGAAALVTRGDQVLLRKGYGLANLELGVPVQPEMVFRLGSITKQFSAVAILLLEAEGKLSLQDEITCFLPDFPTQGQKITLEHLLTHTSGIKNYTSLPEWPPLWRKDLSLADLIALFKDQPLDFAPGEKYSYSNSGYILLGAIVERVSGQSYEHFLQERIFTPLGMVHSGYDHTMRIQPGRVAGYVKGKDGFENAPYLSMTHPHAAGALLSSVDDLILWQRALEEQKVISAAALNKAWTPYPLHNGRSAGYGYGWAINEYEGSPMIHHSGGIHGFITFLLRLPQEQVSVALLTNRGWGQPDPGMVGFKLAALAIGKPYLEPASIPMDAENLQTYTGVYQVDEQDERWVLREDNHLFTQRTGGERQELTPHAPDRFFIKNTFTRLEFLRDAAGQISAMRVNDILGPEEMDPRTDRPLPQPPQVVPLEAAILEQLAGVYELGPGLVLEVRRKEDHLLAQLSGEPEMEIFPASETIFFAKTSDTRFEFTRSETGQVIELLATQGRRESRACKVA